MVTAIIPGYRPHNRHYTKPPGTRQKFITAWTGRYISVFLQTYTACPPPLLSGCIPWCRHQMETFSALVAICAGNSPVSAEFPAQRPVTLSFDIFCDLRLNKRLGKQPWGWWFETPLWSLRRHCNAISDCDIEPLFFTSTHSNIYVLSNGVNIHLWDMLSNCRPLTSFPPLLSK